MKATNRAQAYSIFAKADDDWQAEIDATFGRTACDKRYLPEGKGTPGTPLRAAHDAREAARVQWESFSFGNAA